MKISQEEYSNKVVAGVKERIKNKSWYCGVCTDLIGYCYRDGVSIERAIEVIERDTMIWDAPAEI